MKTRPRDTDAWGIVERYEDASHKWHRTKPATRAAILEAMDVEPSSAKQPGREPVLVLREGATARTPQPAELILEDGTTLRVERQLPIDLPLGYHDLRSLDDVHVTRLIVTPKRCFLPKHLRAWGWAVQLYALRSRKSWGMGDLADLRDFARWSARELHTDFLLLNPLGAPLPVLSQEPSPYYPSSRRFRNPLYLRIEDVPGAREAGVPLEKLAAAGRALNCDRLIDRDAVFQLKQRALEQIWKRFGESNSFSRYHQEQGEPLREFATFCAVAEVHGTGWPSWPTRFQRPSTPAVKRFAAEHGNRIRFHQWLQWLLDEQLAKAAKALPLMQDLPIGVDPSGADAWAWQDTLANRVSVGAPPDTFNTLGQDWGLPPFVPHKLRAAGYGPFRETIRAMLRHGSGLRIDHVMGLFRLFWIPHGMSARDGTFVRYRADELLAILALESHRAKAVIVGEDLGTVEKGVREALHQNNVLSYRLLWFEPKPPRQYPRQALAAVTTHDLFTIAGLWTGSDLRAQQRIGLNPNVAGTEKIRKRLQAHLGLREQSSPSQAIVRTHRLLAQAPSMLLTATLDDALAVEERPNMPGTTRDTWPNWSLTLPIPLERIRKNRLVREVASACKRPK